MRFLVVGDGKKGRSFFSFQNCLLKCCRSVTANRMVAVKENCHSGLPFLLQQLRGSSCNFDKGHGREDLEDWAFKVVVPFLALCLSPILSLQALYGELGETKFLCVCVCVCFHKMRKRGVVSCIRIHGKCEGEGRKMKNDILMCWQLKLIDRKLWSLIYPGLGWCEFGITWLLLKT